MTDRTAADKPTPRLAKLDLHGFKSFANRTVFVFEPGITAIVGPNGSGKSNISDAVRWVLGETSYNALRSKKTEDVIFAGGRGKSPTGMAEVTVTFNNEDQWLPSEFTEVTVTRRAYRGGENQYFINGRRVRLKDVALLTASLGQSYTVVGQGLVDAALSQRAEERRGLFEHAADLTGLRLKVAEAERNLNEADTNTARLTDLLNELEPRLKTLERAARQAKEWQGLRDRMTFLQRGHYRRLLATATKHLTAAEQVIAGQESGLAGHRDHLDQLVASRQTTATELETAREARDRHDARLEAVQEQARRVSHERDLVLERQGALNRRREDMEDTQSGLDEQVARVEADLQVVRTDLAALNTEVEQARTEVQTLQTASQTGREAWSQIEQRGTDLARTIDKREREATELSQRRALLAQKRESSVGERERIDREAQERAERIANLDAEIEAFEAQDAEVVTRIAELDARVTAIAAERASIIEAGKQAQEALTNAERRLGHATNRLDVLRSVHESGTNLFAGVRQVMTWHREGKLKGIRGTVAELIAVDKAYDTALEVALGGHLQDLVVDRWADAEAAIGRLREAKAGRATFQPIDRVGRGGSRPAPASVLNAAGVHGVASDLVTREPEVDGVVNALLGRFVVVDDLAVARRILDDLPTGWSAVTLGGDIARSGGSVTGGSAVRESGVLGRERELRELPDEIARLEQARTKADVDRETLAEKMVALDADRVPVETERIGLVAQRRERTGQKDRLSGWLRDLRNQQSAALARVEAANKASVSDEDEIASLGEALTTAASDLETLRAEQARLLTELHTQREAVAEQNTGLTQAQQALAAIEERFRAEQRRESSLVTQRTSLADEIGMRAQRVAELDGERNALVGHLERVEREIASLQAALETGTTERAPLHEAVALGERTFQELEVQIEDARRDLLDQERALGQHGLTVERARAEMTSIHQRIGDDLGFDDPADLLTDTEDGGEETWVLDDDYEVVEREIGRLRDRLRRVGYVGDDVVAEYERESAHQIFLRTQLDDVRGAATALRQLLADLQQTMHERFEATFSKVAVAFSEAFTTLFGGGTARLVLTGDDDDSAPGGIDIVAQPPGKRLQSLGLLSGGERALTAVALLFAILRVNPTPFVLLDEVDAALDEANVVRFRDELRKLAVETQAIVITHNRGTVEIADTLYGVTMGGDGVSQVLSLRLGDLPLDEELSAADLAAVSSGVPVR